MRGIVFIRNSEVTHNTACCFEDRRYIFTALLCLSLNSIRHRFINRIHRYLP